MVARPRKMRTQPMRTKKKPRTRTTRRQTLGTAQGLKRRTRLTLRTKRRMKKTRTDCLPGQVGTATGGKL
jgi:hypothetical protein